MGKDLCVGFIDCQKAYGHVNWTKLMQILKNIGMKWYERRFITKLDMDQHVEVWMDQGDPMSVKTEDES